MISCLCSTFRLAIVRRGNLVLEKEILIRNVIVVIGAGLIGQAIARRVSAGNHVLLADLRQENANAAAKVLGEAGFEVSTAAVDVSAV